MSEEGARAWRRGAAANAPLAIGVAVYGVAFGVLAASVGMGVFEIFAMGVLVFAGSAQIVAVERLAAGAGVAAAVLAGIALNLRYFLIAASSRELWRDQPFWRRAAGAYFATDENWALTMARRLRGEPVDHRFLIGGGIVIWAAWLISGVSGALLGALVPDPEALAIDFAFTAAFIALAGGLWRGARADLLPWLTAAALAAGPSVAGLIDPTFAVLLGGIAGAALASRRPA